MNSIINPELVEKLNEKLSGLLDLVNTTNAEQLFNLIVKYNITEQRLTLVISLILIVISIIAIIISYNILKKDDYCCDGLFIGIIIVGCIIILISLMCLCNSAYNLFLWSTNPEISVIQWLR